MLSEWEKEELGRLTHSKLKSFSEHQKELEEAQMQSGRITTQNIESMKAAHKKTETGEFKAKQFLERLRLTISQSFSLIWVPRVKPAADNACKVYGHKLPWGKSWDGLYPKCHDCGAEINDPRQLRGAMPISERERFRSAGEDL